MTGANATPFTQLNVGTSDSGDFSSWLGRPQTIDDETYIICQASVAIASGSNGKQLCPATVTASNGTSAFIAILSTGGANLPFTIATIPWTHTGPIAASAYFLALRKSRGHVMLIRGVATDTIAVGSEMVAGSGSDLIPILTGADPLTGELATSSGIGLVLQRYRGKAGMSQTADTGVAAVSGWVHYNAPFRGAD